MPWPLARAARPLCTSRPPAPPLPPRPDPERHREGRPLLPDHGGPRAGPAGGRGSSSGQSRALRALGQAAWRSAASRPSVYRLRCRWCPSLAIPGPPSRAGTPLAPAPGAARPPATLAERCLRSPWVSGLRPPPPPHLASAPPSKPALPPGPGPGLGCKGRALRCLRDLGRGGTL